MTSVARGRVMVGRYHAHAGPPDLDYRLPRTAAGDDLLALLADELEPTVMVRRWSNGHTDLLTIFDA
jgi:hypothetical protein